MNTQPRVSIIIPCYNEENTIRGVLEALARQTFPLNQMEVLIIDGRSEDQTIAQIEKYQQENKRLKVRIVDNPKRIIPAALILASRQPKANL